MCLAKEQGGLGFKDIQSFNQALLVKQAWRILNQPDSLFARLFKRGYFPDSDFLSAKNGPRPSYAWRSIHFGKDLLCQGLRKHLGDGKSVYVWTDAWIEGNERRRPLMKNIFVDILLRVNELIDFENRCWNKEKLEELFYEEDIRSIMSTKIAFDQSDYWVWLHNRNGSYSVKSGYWFINQYLRRMDMQEEQARPSLNDLKADVWKIPTAPKIKAFFWRAMSNAIPVGELLVKRGIKLDSVCLVCGSQGESINHIVFGCSIARQVWALANVPYPENGFDSVSHYSNIHTVMLMIKNTSIPKEVRNSIPWIVWYLWKYRNGVCFEGKQMSATKLVLKIKEEADFWLLAQIGDAMREKEEREAEVVVLKSWSPSPKEWFKCNIGVFKNKLNTRSVAAWVLRNDKGKVVMHSRRVFLNSSSVEEANYKSFLWAVDSMAAHHCNRVIFALDDETFTKVILRPNAWPSFKCQQLELMRRLRKVEWWRVMKEDRSTNRGAFLIAQNVIMYSYGQSYVASGAPSWMTEFFGNEESKPSS